MPEPLNFDVQIDIAAKKAIDSLNEFDKKLTQTETIAKSIGGVIEKLKNRLASLSTGDQRNQAAELVKEQEKKLQSALRDLTNTQNKINRQREQAIQVAKTGGNPSAIFASISDDVGKIKTISDEVSNITRDLQAARELQAEVGKQQSQRQLTVLEDRIKKLQQQRRDALNELRNLQGQRGATIPIDEIIPKDIQTRLKALQQSVKEFQDQVKDNDKSQQRFADLQRSIENTIKTGAKLEQLPKTILKGGLTPQAAAIRQEIEALNQELLKTEQNKAQREAQLRSAIEAQEKALAKAKQDRVRAQRLAEQFGVKPRTVDDLNVFQQQSDALAELTQTAPAAAKEQVLFTRGLEKEFLALNDTNRAIEKNIQATKLEAEQTGISAQKKAKLNEKLRQLQFSYEINNRTLENYANQLKSLGSDIGHASTTYSKFNRTQTSFNQLAEIAVEKIIRYRIAFRAMAESVEFVRRTVTDFKDFQNSIITLRKVIDPLTGDFQQLGQEALNFSKQFGISIENVLSIMKTFAQQGKNQNEIIALTRTALIAMTAADLEAKQAVDLLTAATIQFNIAAQDSEIIIDKIQRVQALHAVTTQDLANALKILGSTAVEIGFSLDGLLGTIAAVGSATRKTGTEVANSLKTILARFFSEDVVRTLDDIGIQALESSTSFKPVEETLDELAIKWKTLSEAERINIAIMVGQTRRYTDFVALMRNYQEKVLASEHSSQALGDAQKAAGLQVASFNNQLQSANNAIEELRIKAGEAGTVPLVTTFIVATKTLSKLVDVLGPATGLLISFASALLGIKIIQQAVALASVAFGKGVLRNAGAVLTASGQEKLHNLTLLEKLGLWKLNAIQVIEKHGLDAKDIELVVTKTLVYRGNNVVLAENTALQQANNAASVGAIGLMKNLFSAAGAVQVALAAGAVILSLFVEKMFRAKLETDALAKEQLDLVRVTESANKATQTRLKFLEATIANAEKLANVIEDEASASEDRNKSELAFANIVQELTKSYPQLIASLKDETKTHSEKVTVLKEELKIERELAALREKQAQEAKARAIGGLERELSLLTKFQASLKTEIPRTQEQIGKLAKDLASEFAVQIATGASNEDVIGTPAGRAAEVFANTFIRDALKNITKNKNNLKNQIIDINAEAGLAGGEKLAENMIDNVIANVQSDAFKKPLVESLSDLLAEGFDPKNAEDLNTFFTTILQFGDKVQGTLLQTTAQTEESANKIRARMLDFMGVSQEASKAFGVTFDRLIESPRDLADALSDLGFDIRTRMQAVKSSSEAANAITERLGFTVNSVRQDYERFGQTIEETRKKRAELETRGRTRKASEDQFIAEALKGTKNYNKALTDVAAKLKIAKDLVEGFDQTAVTPESFEGFQQANDHLIALLGAFRQLQALAGQTVDVSKIIDPNDIAGLEKRSQIFKDSEIRAFKVLDNIEVNAGKRRIALAEEQFEVIQRVQLAEALGAQEIARNQDIFQALVEAANKAQVDESQLLDAKLAVIRKEFAIKKNAIELQKSEGDGDIAALNAQLKILDAEEKTAELKTITESKTQAFEAQLQRINEQYSKSIGFAQILVELGADENLVIKEQLAQTKAEIKAQFVLLRAADDRALLEKTISQQDFDANRAKFALRETEITQLAEIASAQEQIAGLLQFEANMVDSIIDNRKRLFSIESEIAKTLTNTSSERASIEKNQIQQQLSDLELRIDGERKILEAIAKQSGTFSDINTFGSRRIQILQQQRKELELQSKEIDKTFLLEQINLFKDRAGDISTAIADAFASIPDIVVDQHERVLSLEDEIEDKLHDIAQLQNDLRNSGSAEEFTRINEDLGFANKELSELNNQLDKTRNIAETVRITFRDMFVNLGDVVIDSIQQRLERDLLELFDIGGPFDEFTGAVTVFDKSIGNLSGLVEELNRFLATTQVANEEFLGELGIRFSGAAAEASAIIQTAIKTSFIEGAIAAREILSGKEVKTDSKDDPNIGPALPDFNTAFSVQHADSVQEQIILDALNANADRIYDTLKTDSKKQEEFKEILKSVGNLIAISVGTAIGGGGRGASGGAAIGNAIGGIFSPVGAIAGSLLGGLVGGLFDDKKVKKLQKPLTDSIDKNTSAINNLTNAVSDLRSQLINAPSRFSLPPAFSIPTNQVGGFSSGLPALSSNNINITIDGAGKNAGDIASAITSEFERVGIVDKKFANQKRVTGSTRARIV